MDRNVQIIAFYEFCDMTARAPLAELKRDLRKVFETSGVRGTIIIAAEGYNGMVSGTDEQIREFLGSAERILDTSMVYKSSHHERSPFRKMEVKIKPEIVTLKKDVDLTLGRGTHVNSEQWNQLISDPETLVLDTRNDYEYRTGTFRGAVNPKTEKFSDLPAFVAENLDPARHKRVAMFCTGGIRCEKFAPYMKQIGFEEVYQLEGGILKYLEQTPVEETLWEGECFVFDERVTVTADLKKGTQTDLSQRFHQRKDPRYKVAE